MALSSPPATIGVLTEETPTAAADPGSAGFSSSSSHGSGSELLGIVRVQA